MLARIVLGGKCAQSVQITRGQLGQCQSRWGDFNTGASLKRDTLAGVVWERGRLPRGDLGGVQPC